MKRSESSGGLSFDWPSVARTATTGLIVGLILGVIGIYFYGGGLEAVDDSARVPLVSGVYWSVLGGGFELTEHWRAKGGVKFWLSWAVCGGLAAAVVLGSWLVVLDSPVPDPSGALVLLGVWTVVGPLTGIVIGWFLRMWGFK